MCDVCLDKISSTVNDLIAAPRHVVRLLPFALAQMKHAQGKGEWQPGKDFRLICPCQMHRQKLGVWWRRGLRAARNASTKAKSGLALLVGLPLFFGASWVPMDTMTRYAAVARKLTSTAIRSKAAAVAPQEFHVFTTDRVRRAFLAPHAQPQTLTLESSKEAFFRANVPFGTIIYREARRNNLPPELVAAVVESESDFRPQLMSNKNARGLMQIVPETGRLMGAENLFNPEQNIAAGTKYLRYLFDRFGDERMVLAAYNAGEGNIERFGGVPPFTETLQYLQRVTQRRKAYSARVHGTLMAAATPAKAQAD